MTEFGENLEHATPANVRDFLDRTQKEAFKTAHSGSHIVLDEPAKSYEEIIKDFFIHVLDLPKDMAIMTLWTLALELSFAALESQLSDQFADLFKDLDSDNT